MQRLVQVILVSALLVLCCGAVNAEAAKPIQVLLIAGDDVAPYHDWRDISESTRDVLVSCPRFTVKVCEVISINRPGSCRNGTSWSLCQIKLIISHTTLRRYLWRYHFKEIKL